MSSKDSPAGSPGVVPSRGLIGTGVCIKQEGERETMKEVYKLHSPFRGPSGIFAESFLNTGQYFPFFFL